MSIFILRMSIDERSGKGFYRFPDEVGFGEYVGGYGWITRVKALRFLINVSSIILLNVGSLKVPRASLAYFRALA
jgi:hypothetical protein